jgi:hypothetical protein
VHTDDDELGAVIGRVESDRRRQGRVRSIVHGLDDRRLHALRVLDTDRLPVVVYADEDRSAGRVREGPDIVDDLLRRGGVNLEVGTWVLALS